PQALDQVELRRVCWEKEGLALLGMSAPPLLDGMTLVVARVIEHRHNWLVRRERVGQLVEEGQKGSFILACVDVVDDAPTHGVQRAKDGTFMLVASGGNPHRLPAPPPDLCQRGMSVEFALVHVDQMESSGRSSAFFPSGQ